MHSSSVHRKLVYKIFSRFDLSPRSSAQFVSICRRLQVSVTASPSPSLSLSLYLSQAPRVAQISINGRRFRNPHLLELHYDR